MKGSSVYEIVTDRIVVKLNEGVIPWLKPWNARTSIPRNLVTGKPYRGINIFVLGMQAYQSPYWLTFKQAADRGGKIKKGEKGTPVVYWNYIDVEDKATGEVKKTPFLRYYTVFNVAQTEGIDAPTDTPAVEFNPIEEAARIVEGYTDAPEIKHGFTRACYVPGLDEIRMPLPETFVSPAHYYSVLFHEMGHSTGHEKRLSRRHSTEGRVFGDEKYSREELVAEMTAAFLGAQAGIEIEILDNSAAYIQSWLKALQNDTKMVVIAAGQAQKAADHILGIKEAVEEGESQAA